MLIIKLIYNLLLIIFLPLIVPVGYLLAIKKKEENDYFERFGVIKLNVQPEKSVWFHCASVGEVRSLKVLVEAIRENLPDVSIIISTMTYSGKKIAIKELKPDVAFLLPFENPVAIKYLIDYLNVRAFFIVDTELWPNLIWSASKKCSLYLINGRISDRSFKSYLRLKFIFKNLLLRFDKIFVKSEDDFIKFRKLMDNDEKLFNLGNLKFFVKKNIEIDYNEFSFLKGKVFVAGSTHRGEEELVLKAFRKMTNEYDKIFIAPRHLNRVDEIEKIVREHEFTYARWSNKDADFKNVKVIIVDTFGELEKFYKIADKVFVGGSVVNNIGGHNIYEALQFEKVVATGENMWNFKEIFDFAKKYNVVYIVKNEMDMENYLSDKYEIKPDFEGFEKALNESAENKIGTLIEVIKSNLK